MAKRAAPTKPCPKCGESIHPRQKSHEKCGWIADSANDPKKPTPASKGGANFPHGANAEKPTLEEVSKIKAMIDQMGLDRMKAAMRVAEEIA